MGVAFRLLGEVEAHVDGRTVPLGHARQRCVLAALLVDANRMVTVDQLLDRVWGIRQPQRARNALSGYLSRLRHALSGTDDMRFDRQADGYRLTVDPATVDLHRFRRLVGAARDAENGDAALALLDEALALWRGEPFGTLDSAWLNTVRNGIAAERLAAFLDRTDLALARGRHAELLGELSATVTAHPLDERLAGQLMLALYRGGRQADALHHYEQIRVRLAEELGADPSPPLRQVHQRILSSDPALTVTASTSPIGPATRAPTQLATPRQLPTPPRVFTGRKHELAHLDAILAAATEQPVAVVISAVAGTAGVGKTALALHWAHRVADQFPDGQLHVNLRGFDLSQSVMTPNDALRAFLDALAVPPQRIPTSLDAQTGLYRSMLAGKRVLVLLDNARDVEQIRPLLPGTPGCQVLVTSRNHLTGLVAAEGAHQLTLDLLPEADARQLLADRIDPAPMSAEPGAAEEIIALCARLPLALSIVAAHAAIHPHLPLSKIAAELRDGLDAFDGGDAASDLRTVFSWSYHALTDDAARLFRLLGLHPGPDLSAAAAAGLAGTDATRLRPLLAELTRTNMLNEHTPDRYALHDLLRAYANELAHTHDTEPNRRAAILRMLDHYLHTAYAAALSIHPYRHAISLSPPDTAAHVGRIADPDRAFEWFTDEHAVLLAAVGQAAHEGFNTHAWQLAWTLTDYLDRNGHWHDQTTVQDTALRAARRLRDAGAQAHAHRAQARAHAQLGRLADAGSHYHQALELFDELDDRASRAHTHLGLSWVLERQHRITEALDHDRQALDLFRAIDHQIGQARSLNHLGMHHAQLGDHRQALTHCRQALALFQEIGDRHGQAATYDSLGHANHQLGRHEQAVACYQLSAELLREVGDRFYEAQALTHLGDTHHDAGAHDAAHQVWQQAFDILHQLGHPDADQVRNKLRRLS